MSEGSTAQQSNLLQKALAIAVVIVPICVAVIAGRFADAGARRSAAVQMIQLAVTILQAPPQEPSVDLRRWALDVVDEYSRVPLPSQLREALTDSVAFPPGPIVWSAEGVTVSEQGLVTAGNTPGRHPVVACFGDLCDTVWVTVERLSSER